MYLKLPDIERATHFDHAIACPPQDPGKLALKLPACFLFYNRRIDPRILQGIKSKLYVYTYSCVCHSLQFISEHIDYLFPVESKQERKRRWKEIVQKRKCRDASKLKQKNAA